MPVTSRPVQKAASKGTVASKVTPITAKGKTPINGAGLVNLIQSAEVYEMDGIELKSREGGGGREAAPKIQALVNKAMSLKIGVGFEIPKAMIKSRPITNKETGKTSIIYQYEGYNKLRKEGLRANPQRKFVTRETPSGERLLFRVEYTAPAVTEVEELE